MTTIAEMTVESQMKLDSSDIREMHVFDDDSMILKLSDGSFVIEQTFESFDPINCQIYWQSAYFLTDQFEFDRCPDHVDFHVTEE